MDVAWFAPQGLATAWMFLTYSLNWEYRRDSWYFVVFGRYSPNQKGFEDPKTKWGYKTLIYLSTQSYWWRPVFSEIKREMMLVFESIDLYNVVRSIVEAWHTNVTLTATTSSKAYTNSVRGQPTFYTLAWNAKGVLPVRLRSRRRSEWAIVHWGWISWLLLLHKLCLTPELSQPVSVASAA